MNTKDSLLITEESTFKVHLASHEHLPQSILDFKRKSWMDFVSTPYASNKEENWRFSKFDFQLIDRLLLSEDSIVNASEVKPIYFLENIFKSLLINDNQCEREIYGQEQTPGVIFKPLSVALCDHPEWILKYLKCKEGLDSEKLFALHAAYLNNGYFLYVPKDTFIEKPFVAYHAVTSLMFPTTIAIIEEGAKCSIVDVHFSKNNQAISTSIGYNAMHIGANAEVSKTVIQHLNKESFSFSMDHSVLAKNAKLKNITIHIGSQYSRLENQVYLEGEGSHVDMYGLTIAKEHQVFDQRTLQTHNAPGAYSNLLYKNVLFDKAETIFSGLIKVSPNAQKTDAYQKNRNLILSEDAQAHSLPGLEILANDVKCSHGATSGQLDKDELYYLMSRGINSQKAQELLILGFFEEILSTVDNEEINTAIHKIIEMTLQ